MTEYDNSPEAIADYMAGHSRTADWVSRQRDFPLYSPSVAPSIHEDLTDAHSMADSDAWSSKSLPPRMLLRYDDGRPDMPLDQYNGQDRLRSRSGKPQRPTLQTHPEPEEIRILPSKSSSSNTTPVTPSSARRERRPQLSSQQSGPPGAQALTGDHIPPYPQQIAVYAPAPRQAPPLTHAETHPPSRRSGAASTPPLPHPYRGHGGPSSQSIREASGAGSSRGPPPVSYSQSHPANPASHASYTAPSQHSRSGSTVQYQPTPPHTPHRPPHSRHESLPSSRPEEYLPREYSQQPPQTSQSSRHSRHASLHSQPGHALPTPPETPHERSRQASTSTSGRRPPPLVMSSRGSSRQGSQTPALVYAPRSSAAAMDAHYAPPPVVPRSAPADQTQFPSNSLPRGRDASGRSRDENRGPVASTPSERGRRSVDHGSTLGRTRSTRGDEVAPPGIPRRPSTATARTIASESAVMVDIPDRIGRSRSQSVHRGSRRDKSNPRSESSASTYYVLAGKGQKVHVIVGDEENMYNTTSSGHSPASSRSPGSSQSHSRGAKFPTSQSQQQPPPPHDLTAAAAARKAPSFIGRFLNSISMNGSKSGGRKRADSAPAPVSVTDPRGRPSTRQNSSMLPFRSRTPKVG